MLNVDWRLEINISEQQRKILGFEVAEDVDDGFDCTLGSLAMLRRYRKSNF